MNFTKADVKIQRQLNALSAVSGSQRALCKDMKISISTFLRRYACPGDLKLSELRKLKAIGMKYGITFDPLEEVAK